MIKATTTTLDLAKETTIGLSVGFEKNADISITRPIHIMSRSYFLIPLLSSSNRDDVTIKSAKGYEIGSHLEFSSNFLKRENYKLDLLWQNQISYSNSSRDINFGPTSGSLKSTGLNLLSLVGISYHF